MPDGDGKDTQQEDGTPGHAWRQSDVVGAITAAQDAGLARYRVEIAPDGTISIVIGTESSPPPAERPTTDLRGL